MFRAYLEKHKSRVVGLDILRALAILQVVYGQGIKAGNPAEFLWTSLALYWILTIGGSWVRYVSYEKRMTELRDKIRLVR